MPQKQTKTEKSQPQAAKFKAMASEVEANDDESAFDAKLKTLARAPKEPTKGK